MRYLVVLLLCGCRPTLVEAPVIAGGDLVAVRIDLDAGDVTLWGGEEARVEGVRSVRATSGLVELEQHVVDGVLLLRARCAWLAPCSVDLDLTVPRELPVEVRTGAGRVRLSGLSGDLTVKVGDGSVEGDALGSAAAHVQVGWGEVSLGFEVEPEDLSVSLGAGDVGLLLPGDRYALDLAAFDGVRVTGLTDDPEGGRVHARTQQGEIRVGRTPG